jgi:hypothetical protein
MQLFDIDQFRLSLPANVTVFASGANRVTEIRGFAYVGIPVGVSVQNLSEEAIEHLSFSELPVMVDSGAFSEVAIEKGKPPRVTAPISDKEWKRRLGIYERLGQALGEKVLLVAPDLVGSQEVTLQRLDRYASTLERIAATGARFLIPLQVGKMSHEEFFNKAADAAGIRLIPALPMKKAITSAEEIRQFVADVKPAEIHLLGMGERNAKARRIVRLIQAYSPETIISMDSNCLRAKIGENRPLTVYENIFRDAEIRELNGEVFSPVFKELNHRLDYTDEVACPSRWASREQLRAIAAEVGWSGVQLHEFLSNPDEFLQSEQFTDDAESGPWIMDLYVGLALDRQWEVFVHSQVSTGVRSAAISKVFGKKDKKSRNVLTFTV